MKTAAMVDSLVAPLSVVNALVVALCMKRQSEVVNTLESMEKIWDEYQVYSSDEMNHVESSVSTVVAIRAWLQPAAATY